MIVTFGAVGAVFTIKENALVVAKPELSVTVSVIECVPAEKLFWVKEMLPLESENWV